ncbi:putative mannosyl-oligosaccharide alpha-1,2-mannosidase 1B [Cytospora mali]|uniref:alpha-1,2-Mannosidase n=1 Tax=Cytospora mali TaxID=578113 RepID=A0A194VDM0_CYTMA|nr:putative mannosyl-oligosaccharide alpha-1,2-mannosidase 1B [Valsa mali var. pyri (nom. inval.)]
MAARRRSLTRYPIFIALFLVTLLFYRGFPPSVDPDSPSRYPPPRHRLDFKPSTYNWSSASDFFPPEPPLAALPSGKPKSLPRVQHKFDSNKNDKVTEKRRNAVRHAFVRSYNAYKREAWMWDELVPIAGGGRNTFGGWAATLVDCLDTLWIMGLYDDFYHAAQAVVQLDWADTAETSANLFETTIRHLGGLLSAYDLSGEPALLHKAKELGDMLYMAFDTPNRLPGFWINFNDARNGRQVAGTHDPSASPTSLSLEFTRLAQLTGNDKYYDAIDRVRAFLARTQDQSQLPGMWPTAINFQFEEVMSDHAFTIGALADSLYEYLPKMFILTGGLEPSYEKMYRRAMDVIINHILFRPMLPDNQDILFSGTTFVREDRIDHVPEGQHLACFAGGMFLLGGKIFDIAPHVRIGERLTRGCSWGYDAFPTGLLPEIFALIPCPSLAGCEWDAERWIREGDQRLKKGFQHARDPRYILRPEAIESVFILYRVTGKEELREVAWTMFQSIIEATKTPIANSAIADVTVTGATEKLDSMESFWLAETLKYFYLIFSPPDVVSLDDFVLNTEAHPLKRPR